MARTPFKLRSGNSPIARQGHFVTNEHGEAIQVSRTDYYKAAKEDRYSTGRARMTEMNDNYEAMKTRAISSGASKNELAELKEAHISGVFEEYQEAFAYSQTEEGKAEYEKQKELNKK
mgnify:CR=1 FL=1